MFSSPLGSTKIKATIELLHIEEHVHFQNKEELDAHSCSTAFWYKYGSAERFLNEPHKFPCIGIHIASKDGYSCDLKIMLWIYDFEILEQTE